MVWHFLLGTTSDTRLPLRPDRRLSGHWTQTTFKEVSLDSPLKSRSHLADEKRQVHTPDDEMCHAKAPAWREYLAIARGHGLLAAITPTYANDNLRGTVCRVLE